MVMMVILCGERVAPTRYCLLRDASVHTYLVVVMVMMVMMVMMV